MITTQPGTAQQEYRHNSMVNCCREHIVPASAGPCEPGRRAEALRSDEPTACARAGRDPCSLACVLLQRDRDVMLLSPYWAACNISFLLLILPSRSSSLLLLRGGHAVGVGIAAGACLGDIAP